MKKLENAVNSYVQDGFKILERSMVQDSDIFYCLIAKNGTHILIMSNGAAMYEKKIKLVNNLSKYVRRKFNELLFNAKIADFRARHYFVKIIARVENYTLAQASKTTYDQGKSNTHVAYILHQHNKNYNVSISATNPQLEKCGALTSIG